VDQPIAVLVNIAGRNGGRFFASCTAPASLRSTSLRGVAAAKLRQYGEVFLDAMRQHAAEQA
jgi:hypothetical protein